MTQNQLKYWELQETKRKNLASEGLTAADIAVNSQHYDKDDAEKQRHNIQDELLTATGIKQRAISGIKGWESALAVGLFGDQIGLDIDPDSLGSRAVNIMDSAGQVISDVVTEGTPSLLEGVADAGLWVLDKVGKAILTPFVAARDATGADTFGIETVGELWSSEPLTVSQIKGKKG